MIHVYGIVDELDGLPAVVGVDDAPLERRRVDELELVVSRLDGAVPADVSRDAVLRHAQVVEELTSRSRAILPAQFGRAFGDDEELDAAVRTQARELERGLERVRGCVEFGLRVLAEVEGEDAPVATSGAGYMRARLAESKRRETLVGELHEPLARLARATVLAGGDPRSLVVGAYLVPADRVAEFRETVLRIETEWLELTIVCSGPWPPYSFASGSGGAE